ncbi:MAG: NADH-quinone oxidoreductase subunit L, partial [Pseudomonadota bacterium]
MGQYLTIVLAPLVAAVLTGLFGKKLGRTVSHSLCILGVGVACAMSANVLYSMVFGGQPGFEATVYQWGSSGSLSFEVGFLVDRLTALM